MFPVSQILYNILWSKLAGFIQLNIRALRSEMCLSTQQKLHFKIHIVWCLDVTWVVSPSIRTLSEPDDALRNGAVC